MATKNLNLWVLFPLFFLGTGCVPIWTGSEMQSDIDRLKTEQASLNQDLGEKQKEISAVAKEAKAKAEQLDAVLKESTELFRRNNADYGAEIEALRQEIQRMTGVIEKMQFDNSRLRQELELFKEDVDIRFADGGGSKLPDSANELYAYARAKLKEGDTRTARKAAEAFVKSHSKDSRVPAMYQVSGESLYREGQWVSAIFEFQKILKTDSKSNVAADATFYIAESFAKLGKCAEAGVFFDSVIKDYSRSARAGDAKRRAAELKKGKCP